MALFLSFGWLMATLCVVSLVLLVVRRYGPGAIMALFAALYVMSAVLANKLIIFFGFVVPAGTIVFSITFLLTDVLSEFHGKTHARRAVWMGFIAQIVFVPTVLAATHWPSPPFWTGQEAFETTLGNTWRIILGSLLAYVISQNHDVWAFHFLKEKTQGRHLWLRNNLSTIVSQAIDSSVFSVIAFYGIAPVVPLIVGTLSAKVIIAVFDTPFLYLGRKLYRNAPGAGETQG